jgi:Ni,Fe-hydrogenase I small subunit
MINTVCVMNPAFQDFSRQDAKAQRRKYLKRQARQAALLFRLRSRARSAQQWRFSPNKRQIGWLKRLGVLGVSISLLSAWRLGVLA